VTPSYRVLGRKFLEITIVGAESNGVGDIIPVPFFTLLGAREYATNTTNPFMKKERMRHTTQKIQFESSIICGICLEIDL
jgi:hypothetical protein